MVCYRFCRIFQWELTMLLLQQIFFLYSHCSARFSCVRASLHCIQYLYIILPLIRLFIWMFQSCIIAARVQGFCGFCNGIILFELFMQWHPSNGWWRWLFDCVRHKQMKEDGLYGLHTFISPWNERCAISFNTPQAFNKRIRSLFTELFIMNASNLYWYISLYSIPTRSSNPNLVGPLYEGVEPYETIRDTLDDVECWCDSYIFYSLVHSVYIVILGMGQFWVLCGNWRFRVSVPFFDHSLSTKLHIYI